jgi:methyltransferase (TIGR00027 family)
LRKKCIATLAHSALTNGARQIVVVGAGFDPLSLELRLDFPVAEFWEVDHPATQRHKLRGLPQTGTERLHFIAVDLNAAALDGDALIKSSFDPAKRTFWIAEGLLMYLEADKISSLMKTLSSLSASGSQFGFTFMEKQSGGQIRFHSQSKLVDWWLRGRGEPFVWGTARGELADLVRPWRIVRFFDHNDLRGLGAGLADEPIAQGEVICLAEI